MAHPPLHWHPFCQKVMLCWYQGKGIWQRRSYAKYLGNFKTSENSFTQSAHLSGYVGQSASTSIRTATCKIHSRAQRRTGRDVIATHHDPREDFWKQDFLHCYMLISCSLKSFWQRLLAQVGRRILKRLERTNLYNIYNHEKFIYVYILYLYIYLYMSISRDTQTTCNNSLLQLHWQRNDLDLGFSWIFRGISVETDFWEAPLSTTIPSKAWTGKTRFSPGQSMTSSSAISSKIRGFRSPLHTWKHQKKSGRSVVFWGGFFVPLWTSRILFRKIGWLKRMGTVSRYPLFVKMGNKGRIKTTTTINCRWPLPWAAHVLRPCLAWKASGNIRALWWENPCVLEDHFWTDKNTWTLQG